MVLFTDLDVIYQGGGVQFDLVLVLIDRDLPEVQLCEDVLSFLASWINCY